MHPSVRMSFSSRRRVNRTNGEAGIDQESNSHDVWPASSNDFDWDTFLNHTTTSSLSQSEGQGTGGEPIHFGTSEDTTLWTDMFLGDANIDWIGLGDTLFV